VAAASASNVAPFEHQVGGDTLIHREPDNFRIGTGGKATPTSSSGRPIPAAAAGH
jgi:hypothetical protein